MKYYLTVLLSFALSICHGQDTIYYNDNYDKVEKTKATYSEVKHKDKINNDFVVETFYISGKIRSVNHYIDESEKIQHGIEKYWYENGQLKRKVNFKSGNISDTLLTYYQNGQLKRQDIFRKGKFKYGKCYDVNGKEIKHYEYEVMPEYPGGDSGFLTDIQTSLKIPDSMMDQSFTGKVIVNFAVDKNGKITDVNIKESSNPELNNEAIKAILALSKFKPGLLDGEPKKVYYQIPIVFNLK